jgi:hypothetical protein
MQKEMLLCMVSDEGRTNQKLEKLWTERLWIFKSLGFRVQLSNVSDCQCNSAPGKISILFHWPVSAASTSSFPAMYNVATGTAGICNFIQAEEQEKDMKEPRSSRAREGCEAA